MQYKKLTIKIGSNVLTGTDGMLSQQRMAGIVNQVAALRSKGVEVVMVSSGAVAAGRGVLGKAKAKDTISERQLFSSVGQVNLINAYTNLMENQGLKCAQLLVTKDDFRDRRHYLNLRNCIEVLLENGIIPIINENDAISVTELMFTDNDELSGMIASMQDADALFILSNVDGIFNGDPADPASEVIARVQVHDKDISKVIQTHKSNFGRGGMITKYNLARKVAAEGIDVIIANGIRENILTDILSKKEGIRYTRFKAEKKHSPVKKWLAHSGEFAKGTLVVNQGAKQALLSDKASSLLPVGLTKVKGEFRKGDIVRIIDEEGHHIGLGKTMHGAEKAKDVIGKKGEKPIIHYDYLFLDN